MDRSNFGVGVQDFKLPTKQALRRAASMAFAHVELGATAGDTTPETLSQSGRRHLSAIVRGLGIKIAALDGDIAGWSLADSATVDAQLARTKRILDLAADLDVPVVTVTTGRIDNEAPSSAVIDALRDLGEHADHVGTTLAIPTGGADPAALDLACRRVNCPSVRICIDAAGLVFTGHDPVRVAQRLADRICLSHLRDARSDGRGGGYETVLGHGTVDVIALVATMDVGGFSGTHILRRSSGGTPIEDLAEGLRFLEKCLFGLRQ